MSETQIEQAIRRAYSNTTVIRVQGEGVLLEGESNGLTIRMWLNRATKTIETAYPQY